MIRVDNKSLGSDNHKIVLKAEIGRHSHDNAVILYSIYEGCSKEDYNRIMNAANNEKRVSIIMEVK